MLDQVGQVCPRTLITGGLIAALSGLTACTDGGDELPPPARPPEASPASPSPTFDERTTEAWEEIQFKFDGFMETWIKWAAEGSPGGFVDPASVELHEYADAFLWGETTAELADERQNGQIRTGRPTWRDARLIEIDWEFRVQDRAVPSALFAVCVDDSDWMRIDAETGEPVPDEGSGPHLWTVTARYVEHRQVGPEGWALIQREVDRSRPC